MKTFAIGVLSAASMMALACGQASAVPVQWSGNGHYYEYIDATTYANFADALAAAASLSFMGQMGYLATITSQDEQSFLNTLVPTTAWLGGSDAASEGIWEWVTGPETGMIFGYSNWAPGEPNNVGPGEHGLLGWWLANGQWNDIYDGYGSFGIVVEYGAPTAVPLPAALPLLAGALGALGLWSRRRRTATSS